FSAVHCSDFESLSYGPDVLSGKVSPTEKPHETTTKKSGFFSGIKKLFGGGKTTTTVEPPTEKAVLTSSTTAKPISTSTTPAQKPSQNRDFVAPTASSTSTTTTTTVKPRVNPNLPTNIGGPSGINQISSSTTTTTSKPDNRRDYVAPPRPPSPGMPQNPQQASTITSTTTVKPDNRRDYVAPIRPSIPPKPTSPQASQGNVPTFPTAPSNRRDYVNPNIPSTPKFPIGTPSQGPPAVPPRPGSQSPPAVPPRSGAPNILNEKDFPPLGPSRGGNQKPTASPSGSSGGGVSFVPHSPGAPTKSSNKNQLAKDDELSTLTENLLSKDVNNQNEFVTINLQGKTKSTDRTDEAPESLLDVKDQALQSPTIAKMRLLYNNYEVDTSINEYVTPIEHKEENDFVDAIMATSVMRAAMQFLQTKGIVTPDPKTHREYVKTLWFTLYSRGGGRIGSSAFEHVFLNEIKNGTVIGMHNWVYYYEEEKSGNADYKGYIRKVDLGTKGTILKYRFNYNGLEKYANTLFIGTSPELEMAIYTVCFAVRADQDCPISLNQQKINIVTHTWKYRGKQLIGSAYPEI
ncbi:endoribonuclease CG2145-like, partial [Condylostylus longicornis]|uniref:endoribonuclease CG2145-like n=1 Tax=Condylostylus longicornis TaxID=2530218 RepID=UPI00244E3A6B